MSSAVHLCIKKFDERIVEHLIFSDVILLLSQMLQSQVQYTILQAAAQQDG